MAQTKAELEQENAELKEQLNESQGGGQPHVHTAIQTILAQLSVEKGGTLPQNMGGKPYIAAVDLNLEVKRKFVEQGLILIPVERVTHFEVLDGSRKQTFMVIQGTYTIVSSKDGSSVTIGGVGDGSAIGSAVTANIASTNALKNALLRFFLVTEQSAEDQAKETPGANVEEGGPKAGANPAMAKAAAASAPRQAPQPIQVAEPDDKAKIRDKYILNPESPYSRDQVNALMDKVKANEEFRGDDKLFTEVLRRLEAGEL